MTKNSFELLMRRKPNKLSMILEILRVMEERGISKEFILHETKKRHIRGMKQSMTKIAILTQSPSHFISHLINLL